MEAVQDLLRRLPPSNVAQNTEALAQLMPGWREQLLAKVDRPLAVMWDGQASREFICCEYNRDGDSFRSPWTSAYLPPREGGFFPDEELQALETEANDVFSEYRRLYYSGGVSSVYAWRTPSGFAACFAIKKEVDGEETACWDILHVAHVEPQGDGEQKYGLSTTLSISTRSPLNKFARGDFSLCGTLNRHNSQTIPLGDGHIANIGRMIEKVETNLRTMMAEVYAGKTRDVVHVLRVPEDATRPSGL